MEIATLIKRTIIYSAVVFFAGCSWATNDETSLQGGQPEVGHYRDARDALARGDTDEAGTELKLALQANPLDSNSHYLLGSLLASQGMEDEAMVGFQRTIAIDPTHSQALHNLGTLLLRRGEAVPAAELLETAVANDPDYVPPYNSLAKSYYVAGLPELAVATYEEALRRDPSNTIASQNLALLLAAANPQPDKPDEAKQDEKPDKGPPDSPDTPKPDGKDKPPPTKPDPPKGKDSSPASSALSPDVLRNLLRDLPHVTVEDHAGMLTLTGWTRGPGERNLLDRILARWPQLLDLTGDDTGDPQRMLEVDAVLFIVIGIDSESLGFNFLRLISLSYTYFSTGGDLGVSNEFKGFPGPAGSILKLPSSGSLFTASVNYDVNIANAIDERVAVLARPHLTTLNGTPASFLAGGEWVFKVSGIESGNIKPYPFGTNLTVTPTLLRTPGEDGTPRVHIDIQAQRTSVLGILTAAAADEDIVFDKLSVNSQAILAFDQTLILSGLNQRESRITDTGVPLLKDIPGLKYLFSEETTVETNTAIIILLTPRDPAFNDKQNRRALRRFVQKRKDFIRAKQGTKKDWRKFKQAYPDWQSLAPNRFASHFFLVEASGLYRRATGEELVDEELDFSLLDEPDQGKKEDKEKDKPNDAVK